MKIFNRNIEVSPFAEKVLKGTFLLTLGTAISRISVAVAYIILARFLTVEQYGEYGMMKSTIDNFLIFASLGIGLTTTKFISENKTKDKEEASSILGVALLMVTIIGGLVAVFVIAFSSTIASVFLNAPNLVDLLNIVAVIIALTAINGIQNGALLGLQDFKSISIINIFQGITLFVGLCTGGYFFGVFGAIIGNLLSTIFITFLIHYRLKKECFRIGIKISFKNWKKSLVLIYKFAVPASLSTLITAPTVWFLNSLLVNTPGGYSELGIYSAVMIFPIAIQMLNSTISKVLLPIFLSEERDISPKKDFFNYFGTWFISIIIVFPLIVFPELVGWVLGGKYPPLEVKIILYLALFTTLIIVHRQGIARDLIMKNKMWLSVLSMGQWAITALVTFKFLDHYGAVGFALSFWFGYIINLMIFVPFLIKMKICPSFVFYDKAVIAIWALLSVLILTNYFFIDLFIRSLSAVIIAVLLVISMLNIYKNVGKHNKIYQSLSAKEI